MTAQMSIEDIEAVATWAAELPDDDQVHVDQARGHIRIGQVVFADVGSALDLWSYAGHRLNPAAARDLGAALTAWAARQGASDA